MVESAKGFDVVSFLLNTLDLGNLTLQKVLLGLSVIVMFIGAITFVVGRLFPFSADTKARTETAGLGALVIGFVGLLLAYGIPQLVKYVAGQAQ